MYPARWLFNSSSSFAFFSLAFFDLVLKAPFLFFNVTVWFSPLIHSPVILQQAVILCYWVEWLLSRILCALVRQSATTIVRWHMQLDGFTCRRVQPPLLWLCIKRMY